MLLRNFPTSKKILKIIKRQSNRNLFSIPQRATIIGSDESSFRYLEDETAKRDNNSNNKKDFDLSGLNMNIIV